MSFCYEAGPCGYGLQRQLTKLGHDCIVVAPSLIPMKAGDRVKTDRRDAEKLARLHRAGELTRVWVPDARILALRDLVRARFAAKQDHLRARHRLSKFLLRNGHRWTKGSWSRDHMRWIQGIRFERGEQELVRLDYLSQVDQMQVRVDRLDLAIADAVAASEPAIRDVVVGLQALRGFKTTAAATIVAELGALSRFDHPKRLMGYTGLVPSESSSGGPGEAVRGPITKTGNAHVRRVLVEAAWSYQHPPAIGPKHRKRLENVPPDIQAIAWKAQHRLSSRFRRLTMRGKERNKAVTAVARELAAFVWSIATTIEKKEAGRSSPTSEPTRKYKLKRG